MCQLSKIDCLKSYHDIMRMCNTEPYFVFEFCEELDSVIITNVMKNAPTDRIEIPDFVEGVEVNSFRQIYYQPRTIAVMGNTIFSAVEHGIYMGYIATQYEVSSKNYYYCSVDGVLFSKDKTILYSYPAYKTDECYRIPDETKIIAKNAIHAPFYLKKLCIPSTLEEIDFESNYLSGTRTCIEVDLYNTAFMSKEGCLYSADKKIMYHWFLNNDIIWDNYIDDVEVYYESIRIPRSNAVTFKLSRNCVCFDGLKQLGDRHTEILVPTRAKADFQKWMNDNGIKHTRMKVTEYK